MGCDHSRMKELEAKNTRLEDELSAANSTVRDMKLRTLQSASWANLSDDSNPLRLITLDAEEKHEAAKQTVLVHLDKPEHAKLKKECTDLFQSHASQATPRQILLKDMKKEFPKASDGMFDSMDFNGDGALVEAEFLSWVDQHFTVKMTFKATAVTKFLKFLKYAPKAKAVIDEAEVARKKAQEATEKKDRAAAKKVRKEEYFAKVAADKKATEAEKKAAEADVEAAAKEETAEQKQEEAAHAEASAKEELAGKALDSSA